MEERTLQLVVHYDGAGFRGWQRQARERTVQGVMEEALSRLCARATAATGAGRTDAGVHARGQAVGVTVPAKWTAAELRRAMNAVLPHDVWVAAAFEMQPAFHARFSAVARSYSYYIGTDGESDSPFRRRWEFRPRTIPDSALLHAAAARVHGTHCFRAFAVRGTAPETDDHRCTIHHARWSGRPGGLVFEVGANRFLHHMVRFLVGTMLDVATGRRDADDIPRLLEAPDNSGVSVPAPAHGLFLDRVDYPRALYLDRPT